MTTARVLRDLIARPGAFHVALIYDALSAKVAAAEGFEAVFMSGSGAAGTYLGMPDGSLTLTEAAAISRNIANAVDIPVLADCDTGYGNSFSAARTMREFELNHVAAIMIEDQGPLPRASDVGAVTVIPTEEFVGKIRAAASARRDADTVLIARTDAYASLGLEDCVDRLNASIAAGADMGFVQGSLTDAERRQLPPAVRGPVMGQHGDVRDLETQGYKLVLTTSTVPVATKAVRDFLRRLRQTGAAA